LEREGLAPVELNVASDAEHLPCPACGTAAPLEGGACSDCGLQLE
jgi:predicted amidophosphoribosyltransferase